MTHKQILVTESLAYSETALEVLRQLGTVHCADIQERSVLLHDVRDANALVVRLRHRLDGEIMDAAPDLEVIVTPTTGLDHIDLDAAAARGIVVLALKGETEFLNNVTATAELTWALILCLARRVFEARSSVLAGRWDRDAWRGTSLSGRTLGLIGFGRLGRIVADYGNAFRMNVLAHDPYVSTFPDTVQPVSMSTLLEHADIVSLHVPLDPDTVGLFGEKEFACLKPGAWLINTSRGKIVDEAALLAALESHRLGAAALDVLSDETSDNEKWLETNPLRMYSGTHDNLILTPHIGGATVDSMAQTELFMAQKLRAHYDRQGSL